MYLFIKRVMDLLGSLLGIVLLSPLFLVIIFLIWTQMGRPIIFKQLRPGFRGKPFYIYKFRTMTNAKDSSGILLSDDQRMTTVGKWLRKTSLDELPEFINVLKGEMSLIGPRPLLMQYLTRYNSEQARRLNIKPGITGWAQINGRNSINWEEKFALDVWYVDNWSLWLDLKILFQTVIIVLGRKGINAEGSATMPEFMGSSIIANGLGHVQAAATEEIEH